MIPDNTIISFYESCIFKRDLDDIIMKAAERAYRDMCRTIDFPKDTTAAIKKTAETEGMKAIKSRINSLDVSSQEEYDKWVLDTATETIKGYSDKGLALYFGQAQKWINMTMKYLLCLGEDKVRKISHLLHVPIDTYVVEEAQNLVCVNNLLPWSKIIEDHYFSFQENLRNAIKANGLADSPIMWEFKAWSEHK